MQLNRRKLIQGAGALVGGSLLAPVSGFAQKKKARRSIRIAHLTDVHILSSRGAEQGFVECLRHLHALKDRPDLLFFGGDLVMDTFATPEDRSREQWDLFHKVLKAENRLPYRSCIGNHDVFGWNRERSGATGSEPWFGKNMAVQQMQMPHRYYSFDEAGWHFIVLDSVHPRDGNTYVAKLDDEQFQWLQDDLAATPSTKPVMVLSHIPIISFCTYFLRENEKTGDWRVPGAWMHIDSRKIKDVFAKHKNVRVAISGHMHLVDRVDYVHTTYFCNGAVCGNWWRGPLDEFAPGYAIINLYADGSFDRELYTWGWRPEIANP